MDTDSRVVYRFGPFEVKVSAGELLKDGRPIKLQELPRRLLVALLEDAGAVISREELRSRLWPRDTFVDFDGSLRVAVGKLREALNDDASNPRYIETVSKRGYRFLVSDVSRVQAVAAAASLPGDPRPVGSPATLGVAPASLMLSAAVSENRPPAGLAGILEPAFQPADPSADRRREPVPRRMKGIALSIALLVFAVGAFVAYRWPRQQQHLEEQKVLTAVPFTALPGRATSPALSADGSRIAFAWNGGPAQGIKGFDLYVKAVGSETLLRLTQHPAEWISPVWSPDGTQIAFHRLAGSETGIYVVPALGGAERRLLSTKIPDHSFSTISWSPNGDWIAYSDLTPTGEGTSVYLLSTETLESKQISIPSTCIRGGMPAFSHQGGSLAFWCFRNDNDAALYSLQLPDQPAKRITPFSTIPNGLVWSGDDKKLVYSLNKGRGADELDQVTVANGSVQRLVFEGAALRPTMSPGARRLAFESISVSSNIWRRDLLHPRAPAVELLPSSRTQYDAQYSPDGRRIAFASLRAGVQGVWISKEDGSELLEISNPQDMSGSPQWSPDGNKIAFDSRLKDGWAIFISGVSDQRPRKLLTTLNDIIRPSWSRDGKWIYFASDEVGKAGIYRWPASGGTAVLLSKDTDGFSPQESFDGKKVYFASHDDQATVMEAALPGQPTSEFAVHGMPLVSDARLWTLSPGGIYFVPAENARSLRYFDFFSKQVRPIFAFDNALGTGISVSADGHWLLYSQDQSVSGDIMLVDHFP